jgi:hypothetical protein
MLLELGDFLEIRNNCWFVVFELKFFEWISQAQVFHLLHIIKTNWIWVALEGHCYASFFGNKTSWINEVVFGKEPLINYVLLVIDKSIINHLKFILHIKDLQKPKASLQPLLYLSFNKLPRNNCHWKPKHVKLLQMSKV